MGQLRIAGGLTRLPVWMDYVGIMEEVVETTPKPYKP